MQVRAVRHETLAGALGLESRELVAMVGGGGKTGALALLARELAAEGSRVVATTTTAMFLRELSAMGPVVMEKSLPALRAGLGRALAEGGPVGAARGVDDNSKVAGLATGWVDDLWTSGLMDHLIVEADGSRGRSLKAFGPNEPQVPAATTMIVQVAGLDALDNPLTEDHVHRASLLAQALGVSPGSAITTDLFADCLGAQLQVLRHGWPGARVVTLLNKSDLPDLRSAGLEIAEDLLVAAPDVAEAPDAVVVASVRDKTFLRVVAAGGD